jgi:hypothetical protein
VDDADHDASGRRDASGEEPAVVGEAFVAQRVERVAEMTWGGRPARSGDPS